MSRSERYYDDTNTSTHEVIDISDDDDEDLTTSPRRSFAHEPVDNRTRNNQIRAGEESRPHQPQGDAAEVNGRSSQHPEDDHHQQASSSREERPPRPILECPICMEDAIEREASSTICGHVFCYDCIVQAITQHTMCPMCCKTLETKDDAVVKLDLSHNII